MSVCKQRTKVVVRRLPPGLTEHAFKATIDKLLPEGSYNWFSYFQGKVSLRKTVLSRAYLNFVDPAAVYDFKAKFDGHAFITTKGSQFKCTVEYAPFQKVPNPPRKRNPLEGTIDQDPHYQAFLKTLESGPELLPSAAVQREQQEKAAAAAGGAGPDSGAVKVTPLMEYLRNKYLSNPGLRLGGIRRNKGKASATPPVNAKATKVSGRAAAAAAAGAKTTSSKQGKDVGAAEHAQGQAKAILVPAGAGPGKGGKQQQQQQQKQGSGSQVPKIMAHPQQQQQQQQQQGRPSNKAAQHQHQQNGKGAMGLSRVGGVAGTAAVPTAAPPAAGPVKIMPRPASAVQASAAPTPATPSSHAGAATTTRPASAAAPASSPAATKSTPFTSMPSAPKVPTPASSTAAAAAAAPAAPPAAPPATAASSETTAESAAATDAGGAAAPPPSGRPERVRRVRAGFAAYQPKRRGGDEDG